MAAIEWIMLALFVLFIGFVAGGIHTWLEARSRRREWERLSKKWPTGMRPEDWEEHGS